MAARLPPFGAVHCWRVALDLPDAVIERLRETLTPAERRRAAALCSGLGGRRFVAAHGALRELLGHYLGLAPGLVGFTRGAQGRPELAAGGRLRFSLSRTDGLALVAIAAQAEVGVDVERLRPVAESASISDRFFAVSEADALAALPPSRRDAAFLGCWTRKEAYLKALGCGLSAPLDGFSLPLPGQAACEELRVAARRWSLLAPRLATGYVAAVAVAGWGWRLIERPWRPRRSAGAARGEARTSPRR